MLFFKSAVYGVRKMFTRGTKPYHATVTYAYCYLH